MTPSNLAIFREQYAPRMTRVVNTPDGTANVYSALAVGIIEGKGRTIPALVCEEIGTEDRWYLANLYEGGKYVNTVAVLGATSPEQAEEWASRQFAYEYAGNLSACSLASKGGPLTASADALQEYLDSAAAGVAMLPIRSADIAAYEGKITDRPVGWNQDILISHATLADLIHELARRDKQGMMMDAMSAEDLPFLVAELGGEVPEFDAIIVDYNRLELMQERLMTAMHKASTGMEIKPMTVQQTKPFKRSGVTNVAVMYELSDGQTVTIVFHSPDATPAKLGPRDTLTSWKWMLNKRDVTVAVAPENGLNVQLPVLAKRIMMVAAKNSARFKRTNAKKAEQVLDLNDTTNRIEQKTATLDGINAEIDSLQKQIDAGGAGAPAGAASSAPTMISGKKILAGPVEYSRKITIPKHMVTGDEPRHYIENGQTSFQDFRIYVADSGRGPHSFVQYKDNEFGIWLDLKGNAQEDRYFEPVANKARELYEDYMAKQSQQQGDLLGGSAPADDFDRKYAIDELAEIEMLNAVQSGGVDGVVAVLEKAKGYGIDAVKKCLEVVSIQDLRMMQNLADHYGLQMKSSHGMPILPSVAELADAVMAGKAKPANDGRLTPDTAANLKRGDVVITADGQEFLALGARHDWLEVAPIVNGKAQVNNQDTFKFLLTPEKANSYPDRRSDPVYPTGRNLYAEQEKAKADAASMQRVNKMTDSQLAAFAMSLGAPSATANSYDRATSWLIQQQANGTDIGAALARFEARGDKGKAADIPTPENQGTANNARPENWRTDRDAAASVASGMGIDTKGMQIKKIVTAIEIKDRETRIDAAADLIDDVLADVQVPEGFGIVFDKMREIKNAYNGDSTLSGYIILQDVSGVAKDDLSEVEVRIAVSRPGDRESATGYIFEMTGPNRGFPTGKTSGSNEAFTAEDESIEGLRSMFADRLQKVFAFYANNRPATPAKNRTLDQKIKLVADSVEKVRKQDVQRLIESIEGNTRVRSNDARQEMADYLKAFRPDLAEEVDSVLFDLQEDQEVEPDDLARFGQVEVTSQGGENIYFTKDGQKYYSKVMNTERFPVGKFDMGAYPEGLPKEHAAWHTEVPTEGLPELDKEKDRFYDSRLITSRIADDAIKAITRNQIMGNVGLYAYYLPSVLNTGRHGIVRLFPDDQKPGGNWKLLDSQVFRIGMTSDADIKARLVKSLSSAQVLAHADNSAVSSSSGAKAVQAKADPDRTLLEGIINGTTSAADVDMDALIAIAEKYDGNQEMEGLVNQALDIVTQAELEAAKAIG